MSHFRFILQMSLDAIGVASILFWFPACASWLLFKRLMSVTGLVAAPQKGEDRPPDVTKHGLRVMFTPSDNSSGSGAFRCMVELASLLKARHGVDSFVVLPCDGSGTQLLVESGIPYVTVRSYGWTVPLGTNMRLWRNAGRMTLHMFSNLRSVREMRRLIRRYNVDVVHVNTTWTYVGALAA